MKTVEGAGSDLELSLVTTAIISSLILTILAAAQPLRPSFGVVFLTLSTIFAAAATSLTALLLGWLRLISLDALATAIIGLLPAAQAVRLLPFAAMRARGEMSLSRSLAVVPKDFRYIRAGLPCICVPPDANCQASVFIRHEASSWDAPPSSGVIRKAWYGRVMEYNSHAVKLCDDRNGEPYYWWSLVTQSQNAVGIVCDPESVVLKTRREAIRALSLLADIVVAGDWVLKRHGADIEAKFLSDSDFRDGLNATPGSVCNAFLQRLGLKSWGSVSGGMQFPHANRAQKYAVLFFMLIEKSHMFSRYSTLCGADIVDEVWRTGDALNLSKRWVQGWGLKL